MKTIKNHWDILKNWQLIFPLLGFLSLFFSAYLIVTIILPANYTSFSISSSSRWLVVALLTILFYFCLLKCILLMFKKLQKKWKIKYRWEMIAIFLVFAVTGSTASKIAKPLLDYLHVFPKNTNIVLYWFLRIFLILPIYQVLLIVFGWLFGQYSFFWEFEKKILRRFGLKIK